MQCRYVPNAKIAFEYPNDFVTEEDVNGVEAIAAESEAEDDYSISSQAEDEPSDADFQTAEKG